MGNLETLVCAVGAHEWQRERARGRKPTVCPNHSAPEETQQRKETARAAAQEADQAALRQQLAEAEASKLTTDEDYRQALSKASRRKGFEEALWNRADNLMSTSLQLGVTIKNLKRRLEESKRDPEKETRHG